MRKQGYAESTIERRSKILEVLAKRGANLYDPESVKETLARQKLITFHTFRHWKATMEYAKTKDILYVMKLLGHKNIKNTLKYTQLVNFSNDEYHFATAKTIEAAGKLIEAGFEGVMLFRKRK